MEQVHCDTEVKALQGRGAMNDGGAVLSIPTSFALLTIHHIASALYRERTVKSHTLATTMFDCKLGKLVW